MRLGCGAGLYGPPRFSTQVSLSVAPPINVGHGLRNRPSHRCGSRSTIDTTDRPSYTVGDGDP